MQPGQIVLKDRSISGLLQVAYSRFIGPEIQHNQPFDTEPMWRSLRSRETVTPPEALLRSIANFQQLYEITREERWQRAAVAAISMLEAISQWQSPTYLFKRERNNVLAHPGTRINSTNPHPILARRNSEGCIEIIIPQSVNSTTQLEQQRSQVMFQPGERLISELGLSINGLVTIAIVTEDGTQWQAAFAASAGTGVTQQEFDAADFTQWPSGSDWYPGLSTYTFSGDTGLVRAVYENQAIEMANPAVLSAELSGNFDYAGLGLFGKFKNTPSPIYYALSNAPVYLRLKDGSGWYWERLLPVTGGQFTALNSSWNDFSLSAEQINGGTPPREPDTQRAIQATEFVASREFSRLSVYYVGAAPIRFHPPAMIRQVQIISRESQLHTLRVGHVQMSSISRPQYAPGVLPPQAEIFEQQVQRWRGHPVVGQQTPVTWQRLGKTELAQQTYHFLADAQLAYQARIGIVGPFAPSYSWANQQFDWQQNWGGWQAQAIAAAAEGWWHQPTQAIAQTVVMRFLTFLDQYWEDGGAVALVSFPDTTSPIAGEDLGIVALYARAALYANLAGGDRQITYRILQKSLSLVQRGFDFPLAAPPQGREGWQLAAIMESLAVVQLHKQQLSYPTPSDLGDRDSDFATKLIKYSQLNSLALPKNACYGFRFQIPLDSA